MISANCVLPKLKLLPAVGAYGCVQGYNIFYQPLMLLEIWANICVDVNSDPNDWTSLTFVHAERDVSDERFALLSYKTLIRNGTPLKALDVVLLKLPSTKRYTLTQVFGVVSTFELRPLLQACSSRYLYVFLKIQSRG